MYFKTSGYFRSEIRAEDVLHSLFECVPGRSHDWIVCNHHGPNSEGSSRRCNLRSQFILWTHSLCSYCGAPRYVNRWGRLVTELCKLRLVASGALPEKAFDK